MRKAISQNANRLVALLLTVCMVMGIVPMPDASAVTVTGAEVKISGISDYASLTPYGEYPLEISGSGITVKADDGIEAALKTKGTGEDTYVEGEPVFKTGGAVFGGTVKSGDAVGYISKRGYFIPTRPGTAVLEVTATSGNDTLIGNLSVTVKSAGTTGKYVYDFKKMRKYVTSYTIPTADNILEWWRFTDIENSIAGADVEILPRAMSTTKVDTAPWQFIAQDKATGRRGTPTVFGPSDYGPDYNGEYVIFKLRVPEDGKYKIQAQVPTWEAAPTTLACHIAAVSAFSEGDAVTVAAVKDAAIVTAEISPYSATRNWNTVFNVGICDLAAGDYYFAYDATEGKKLINAKSIIFNRIGEKDSAEDTLSVKDNAQVNAYSEYALVLTDGTSTLTAGDSGVGFTGTVTPADKGYVTADGRLVTKKAGEITVVLNAWSGDVVLSGKKTISVAPINGKTLTLSIDGDASNITPYGNYPVKLTDGSITLKADDGISSSLNIDTSSRLMDGKPVFTAGGVTFTAEVSDPSVGYVSKRGYFIPTKPGTATVKVTATDGDAAAADTSTFTGELNVTVKSAGTYTYDFSKMRIYMAGYKGKYRDEIMEWWQFTDFANSTVGDDVEILPQALATTKVNTAPWQFIKQDMRVNTNVTRPSVIYASSGADYSGSYVIFKLRVPEEGKYRISANTPKHANAVAKIGYYVTPASAVGQNDTIDTETMKAKAIAVADAQLHQATADGNATDILGLYDLEAGDYYFTYERLEKAASGGNNIPVKAISLAKVGTKGAATATAAVKNVAANALENYGKYALSVTDSGKTIEAGSGAVFNGTVTPSDAGYITKDGYLITKKTGSASVVVNATNGTDNLSAKALAVVVSPVVNKELTLSIDGAELDELTPYGDYAIVMSNESASLKGDDGISDKLETSGEYNGSALLVDGKAVLKEKGVSFTGTVTPSDMGYISKRGYFIAKKPGTAAISVSATDGESTFVAHGNVTVKSAESYEYNFEKMHIKMNKLLSQGLRNVMAWWMFNSFDNSTIGSDDEILPKSLASNGKVQTAPWAFAAQDYRTGGASDPSDFVVGGQGTAYRGAWVILKIRLPEDGKYKLVSHNAHWADGAKKMEYYLTPVGAVKAGAEITPETMAASACASSWADLYSTTVKAYEEDVLGVYDLSAGDYYLTYNASELAPAGNKYIGIIKMAFNRVGNKGDTNAQAEFDGVAADKLESYNKYKLVVSNGTSTITGGDSGAVFSGTVEPASAGYITKDGYLVTRKAVNAEITVTATSASTVLSAEKLDIKVKAIDGAGLDVSIDGQDETQLKPYTQNAIVMSSAALSVTADMEGMTFSGTVEPSDMGYISSRGYFIAEKTGDAKLTVTATDGESSFTGELDVTVVSKSRYVYNFLKTANKPVDPSASYIDHIKWIEFETLNTTIAGDDAELHRQADMKTPANLEITDPWCFDANYSGKETEAPNTFAYGYGSTNYGPYFRENWVRFKIRIPESGKYSFKTQNANFTGGGLVNFFLAPADKVDKGVSPTSSIYELGELNTYRATAAEATYNVESGVIGTRNIKAGDYYLTINLKKKLNSETYTILGFDKVIFDRVGEYEDNQYVYNFMKLATRSVTGLGADNAKGVALTDAASYDAVANLNPGTVEETDPWYYVGKSAEGELPFVRDYMNYGMYLNGVGNYVQFMIDVPESGFYQPISVNGKFTSGGTVEYFLAPKGAQDTMAEEYKLAMIDTYADEADFRRENVLKTVELSAGEYVLTYRIKERKPTAVGAAFVFDSFILRKTDALPDAQLADITVGKVRIGIPYKAPINFSMTDGSYVEVRNAEITATPANSSIVTAQVVPNDDKTAYTLVLNGVTAGTTTVEVSAKLDEATTLTTTVNVEVKELVLDQMSFDLGGVITDDEGKILILNKEYPVNVTLTDDEGENIPTDIEGLADIDVSVAPAENVTWVKDSVFRPAVAGDLSVSVNVTLNGVTKSSTQSYIVRAGKTEVTVYTQDKIDAARTNIEMYDWAKAMKNAAVKAADKYVDKEEFLWNAIPGQTLPRAAAVGYIGDPQAYNCRHPSCGVDIRANYGMYAWWPDPMNSPWKIQCPACRRKYPSNDFESFYKLGLDEHGIFDRALAYERNNELIAQGHPGYLVNELYPELGKEWGVDDGFGYKPGNIYENGVEEVHTYIAFYIHYGLWYNNSGNPGIVENALNNLREAYLYTGDKKYGRVGAILLDRVADLYPDYDLLAVCQGKFHNSHDNDKRGKAIGAIWECRIATCFAKAYDAFYPVMDDPYVVNFLSEKAEKYKLGNPKTDADLIRANCDDGILREIYQGATDRRIYGNMGMHQQSVTYAAVVLNTLPESRKWLDWVMRSEFDDSEETKDLLRKGGHMNNIMVDSIDRDGFGEETSPGYNAGWVTTFYNIAEVLEGYELYPEADLMKNPKFRNMFGAFLPLTMTRNTTVALGDSGAVGYPELSGMSYDTLLKGFNTFGDVDLAQALYYVNGNTTKGMKGDIFRNDNGTLEKRVQSIIDEHGEFDFDASYMLPSYGFAMIKGGSQYKGASQIVDTQNGYYMHFGRQPGHAHFDEMNLGIYAYGLDFAPDFGYPESADSSPNEKEFQKNTISHNTVIVNEVGQGRNWDNYTRQYVGGTPYHFDDSDQVKVMDADAPNINEGNVTDIYRRTVVSVKVNDDISYGVDFFRVKGGKDHLYSFHAQSADATINIPQQVQVGGTYAGADVPYYKEATLEEHEDIPLGYRWFTDVRKAENPGTGSFMVDFAITDFRKMLEPEAAKDLHLRMHMTNTFDVDEVSLVKGRVPDVALNKMFKPLEFVLVRHKGEDNNLDTLFASVFEPFRGEAYIKSVENVTADIVSGTPGSDDRVQAVKVTHTNDRVDYIVYSTNNAVEYSIKDGGEEVFTFAGFIGVYSLKGTEKLFSYVNDGTKIGDDTGLAAVTGTVKNFTKTLEFNNTIEVELDQNVDPQSLVGEHIYIDNDIAVNATYLIKGVEPVSGNRYILDVGEATTICIYKDRTDINAGYIYTMAEEDTFRIPLARVKSTAPVFTPVADKNVAEGAKLTYTVSASSPAQGRTITYKAASLPRGATFDAETQTITWVPDRVQVGDNYIGIEASDGILSSTQFIKVTVHKSALGSDGAGSETPAVPAPPAGGGGGGAAGGGAGAGGDTTQPEDTKPEDTKPGTGDEGERFIDLGNHDWAKEAIYYLVEKGVINGTSANTYSPAANIKRADFAIMLTRAFDIADAEGENFADVDASKYYAEELRLAKSAGIVAGVGNNNFNPEGEITRQDMMLMLYRALKAQGYELSEPDHSVLADFSDSALIADYAKDAVSVLIKDGIITGSNGRINPKAQATRAEIAVMLSRVIK